jgi:hypothetical protein
MGDQPRVFLGNISRGQVGVPFVASLFAADRAGVIQRIYLREHGPYLDDGRNYVVEKFMDDDCDVLLFVDSDIEFTPEQVMSLVAYQTDQPGVYGGWYANPADSEIRPVIYDWKDKRFVQWSMEQTDACCENLRVVGALGCGFLSIHRDVLDAMAAAYAAPQPWFAELVVEGVHLGEDLTFALRAAQVGYPSQVLLDTRVNHYKTTRL